MPACGPPRSLSPLMQHHGDALGQRLARDRLGRQPPAREIEERAAPHVLEEGEALLPRQRDQLLARRLLGEADHREVAGVDAEEEPRLGPDRALVVAPGASCWWSRPRAGGARPAPRSPESGSCRRSPPAARARRSTSFPSAKVLSARSIAAALLFTTSAASVARSSVRSGSTCAIREPRAPVSRSSSRSL